ncbi:hypothetical protein TWF225_010856 [Orbilia oligospora]|nr:hypothetical protein TWF225_010856 [Orbilia oligospora]KAF3252521.1 hypothetical protein TWF217_007716 [Orbilia oligospora]KAF3271450.1 hypothetical protein TWF128_000046 [Orbilia oligospora]KAF3292647.1 hypothetical protein TWF132_005361 [Orbilia oligospora]
MHLSSFFVTLLMGLGAAFPTYTELEDVFTIVKGGPGACTEGEAYTINLYHMDIISMLEAGLEMFNDALERETVFSNKDVHLRQIGARLMIESWFGIDFKDPYEEDGKNIYHAPIELGLFFFIQGIMETALGFIDRKEPLEHLNAIKPKIYCNDKWILNLNNTNFNPKNEGCAKPNVLGLSAWQLSAITLCPKSFQKPKNSNLLRGGPPGPMDPENAMNDHISGSMLLLHEIIHLVLGPQDRQGKQVELYTADDCRAAIMMQITPLYFEAKRNPQSYVWFMQGAYLAREARYAEGSYFEYSRGQPWYITMSSNNTI